MSSASSIPLEAEGGVFDLSALADAIETERLARGITWKQLTDEVRPGPPRPGDHPISASALSTMGRKARANSTIVLQVLLWLDRTPESFIRGRSSESRPDEILRPPSPGQILRFDVRALHAALEERRTERRLTWQQVADEMPRISTSMLAGLPRGRAAWLPMVGFPEVATLTQWIGRPAASFVRGFER
jgi:hypothetical protein